MPTDKKAQDGYDRLSASIKSGQYSSFYIFHGDERYLLENSLGELRHCLVPDGMNSFNYKRFEGKDMQIGELEDAIDTLPVFAERTLIEVHDFDIFKGKGPAEQEEINSDGPEIAKNAGYSDSSDKKRLAELFSGLPPYVCLIIVYDTINYKPDNRQKLDKEMLKNAQVIEFTVREQSKLTAWISRHFEAFGKQISRADAEYLTLITDGYMSALLSEIGKVSAYSSGSAITREDIDAVVTPVLNAFAYKMTDALLDRRYEEAMRSLNELLQMREPAHKILYSISLKMRQFLAARICIENKLDKKSLMEMCGIRFDFQATALLRAAQKTRLAGCCEAVILCSKAAYDLNSSPEPEARLVELVASLAL